MKPSFIRRAFRYGLTVVVLAGFYVGYCEWRTQRTVARLRELGAEVSPVDWPYDWWARVANTVGIAHDQLIPARRIYHVSIQQPTNLSETLRHVAQLPEARILTVQNAPDCDDAALAIIKDCTWVERLALQDISVTDAGIRQLAGWKQLQVVLIYGAPVTEATERFFKGFPAMRVVIVDPTPQPRP